MKLRRKTALLKKAAAESLCLAVELFNRPSTIARDQSVMLLLAHSFEMLLKAAIFQARGTIKDPSEEYSYQFGKCIAIGYSDLNIVSESDLPMLRAIKQDRRNAAAHESVAFSEDLLWLHVRSGVTIFGRLLAAAFQERLAEIIPARVMPVSALPPTDASAVIEREMQDIAELLAPGRRRSDEAEARLRPLLALDGSVTGREDSPTEKEISRAMQSFRKGLPWRNVFPGLASLEIAANPGDGAQEVSLRISRSSEGPPVRLARAGEEALLYRRSNPFDEFGTKLTQFGAKLGRSQTEGYALIWHLKLKEDPDAYFVQLTKNGNVQFQGLSARALDLARRELERADFDLVSTTRAFLQSKAKKPSVGQDSSPSA